MSILTNPADGAAEGAQAYIEAVLGLLGDAEPMDVLAGTVAFCRRRVDGLAPEALATPEKPGKWSVAGVLQHLADSELVWGYRLRRVLAEDRPRLDGFDQDLWARRLGYDRADADAALGVFGVLREANLTLLRGLGPHDLARESVHAERGGESVEHMMRLYAGHDLAHRAQIDRIIATVA